MAGRTPRGRGKGNSGKKAQDPGNLAKGNVSPNRFGTLTENDEEESSVCSVCDSSLPDGVKSLQCERCMLWNCLLCASVNKTEYTVLSRRDFHWYCANCQEPAQKAVRSEKLIEDRCKEYLAAITQRIESVENEVKSKASQEKVNMIDTEVKSLELTVKGVAGDVSALNKKCDLLSNENAEKERRKTNVVIRGIPEDDTPDADKVKLVLEALDVSSEPKSIHRLGKKIAQVQRDEADEEDENEETPQVRHRPLRIICEDETVRTEIVKKIRENSKGHKSPI